MTHPNGASASLPTDPAASTSPAPSLPVSDSEPQRDDTSLIEFTVDRKTWLRGEDSGYSMLLRYDDGKRCCVGFLVQQVFGLCDGEVTEVRNLLDIDENLHELLGSAGIYWLNDDPDLRADSVRENLLTRAFAKIGYRPIFIDGEGA